MSRNSEIVIAGAGSIGCFVGGLLLDSGRKVSFLGRKRIAEEIREHGLHLTDYTGLSLDINQEQVAIIEDPKILGEADIILVCTKSAATAEISDLIAKHAKQSAIVVSLQNGIRNADVLRSRLTSYDVRAGMVGFNVISAGSGRFHRGTSGEIVVESGNPDVTQILETPHVSIESSEEIEAIQSGKLLMNLNNAINALSGLTLKEQLANRNWRTKMAQQISEGLAVMTAAGLTPKPPTPVPAWVLPYVLRLPDPVFKIVAKKMLEIDPNARSSMAEDVERGRKTEIDEFQGEIIRLGDEHSIPTPACGEVLEKIRQLEVSS